jgi:tetratricopeptide (TPR) repeat protein
MYNCPACGVEVAGHDSRCYCGSDLSLLLQMETLADVWFNRALVELNANRHGRALEWLSAACALRPSDAAALRIQSKVWAQLGHYDEALDALERSAQFEPDAPQFREIAAALEDVKANQESQCTEVSTRD